MWSAIHNTYRYLLVAMAFTMTFFLTPRAWVAGNESATHEQVPVDALEDPGDCLWCDQARSAPAECSDDENQLWLNPDQVSEPNCDDDETSSSGPNA